MHYTDNRGAVPLAVLLIRSFDDDSPSCFLLFIRNMCLIIQISILALLELLFMLHHRLSERFHFYVTKQRITHCRFTLPRSR